MKKALLIFMISISLTLTGCSNVSIVDKDVEKEYILNSDTEVITEVDLSKLNDTELKYAYEEIFARHGKIYTDTNYEKYFNSKDWYVPNPSYDEDDLSELEKENSEYINAYILSKKTEDNGDSENNASKFDEDYFFANYSDDNTYIIPDSSVRKLTVSELYSYSSSALALIRNEIYARNGYIFTKQKYSDYFNSKRWYSPNPYFNESWLSSTEKYNIQLIKSLE